MKAGRAIVATDVPANRRVLDESTTVFTDVTAEAFAEGISTLVQDTARRAEFAKRGPRIVAEKYNFEVFQQSVANGYRRMVD